MEYSKLSIYDDDQLHDWYICITGPSFRLWTEATGL